MTAAPDRYSAEVLAHFHAPRNAGGFPSGTTGVLMGRAGERRHGRAVEFSLRFEGGKVAECRYRVYGCPATIALCSLLSERVRGLAPVEARSLSAVALADELGLAPEKRAAALLLEDALRAALLLEDALRAALAEYNMESRRETA